MAQFAVHHGLNVEEVHLGRRVVMVSGTVAKLERAFWVELHLYQIPKAEGAFKPGARRAYAGRAGFIHIPRALAGIVLGVFGLETPSIGLRNATNADPPNTRPLTVPDVARLYNFPPGSAPGQTIGIISNAGYQPQDIQRYFGA